MKQGNAVYYHAESNKKYTFLFPDDAQQGDIYYDRPKDSYIEIVDDEVNLNLSSQLLREITEKVVTEEEKINLSDDSKQALYIIRKKKQGN